MRVEHQSGKMDWQTPGEILMRVEMVFQGKPYLDPCTSADNPVGARVFWTESDDALGREHWPGPYYCNPPYGRTLGKWADHIAMQHHSEGIVLVPARTDTKWFHTLWDVACQVCFIKGRLRFVGASQGAPFPSAVFYRGARPFMFEREFEDLGRIV